MLEIGGDCPAIWDQAARLHESQALQAKGQSNRVAARLALANAAVPCGERLRGSSPVRDAAGTRDRSARCRPGAVSPVIRANLAAWEPPAATLLYTFRLPGSNPSERRIDAERQDAGDRQLFVSRVGDQAGSSRSATTGSPANGHSIRGAPVGPDFPIATTWLAISGEWRRRAAGDHAASRTKSRASARGETSGTRQAA